MIRFRSALATLALWLSCSLAAAQTPPEANPEQHSGRPVVGLSEIVLEQYAVKNVDPEKLFQLAGSLVGRTFTLRESNSGVMSMRLLGRTIVLYDTKEQVQRARELLERLDAPPAEREESIERVEYQPRFLSLRAVSDVASVIALLDVVEERGLIVLHDHPADVEQALALLKRVDVPERQVMLTCQLVEVGVTPQAGSTLAKELADNLQKLLPQMSFAQTGMAMLKTSIGGQSEISIRIDSNDRAYRLTLTPIAFDESTGSLTVDHCTLLDETNQSNVRELFRTNTVLRGGEYTVLAATGASPKLLVVRVVPQ